MMNMPSTSGEEEQMKTSSDTEVDTCLHDDDVCDCQSCLDKWAQEELDSWDEIMELEKELLKKNK